jgi:predicted amidohydrolase
VSLLGQASRSARGYLVMTLGDVVFLAAAIQLTSTSDVKENLASSEALIRRAAGHGAQLIVTPENTNYLGPHDHKVRIAEAMDGPTVALFTSLAEELALHLVVGSFNERSEEPDRCYNTSIAIGPDGSLLGTYRKLHLFDVDCGPDIRFQESATTKPGDHPTLVRCPLATMGLSICYDLRFPELYRHYRDQGATLLTVPSAFTLTTGKDHWHPLLRARAIENQCFVIAAGQCGKHDDGGLRESYGHSMIVDPWGHILAMAPDGPGLAMAEINLKDVEQIRNSMPLSSHRRL